MRWIFFRYHYILWRIEIFGKNFELNFPHRRLIRCGGGGWEARVNVAHLVYNTIFSIARIYQMQRTKSKDHLLDGKHSKNHLMRIFVWNIIITGTWFNLIIIIIIIFFFFHLVNDFHTPLSICLHLKCSQCALTDAQFHLLLSIFLKRQQIEHTHTQKTRTSNEHSTMSIHKVMQYEVMLTTTTYERKEKCGWENELAEWVLWHFLSWRNSNGRKELLSNVRLLCHRQPKTRKKYNLFFALFLYLPISYFSITILSLFQFGHWSFYAMTFIHAP